MSVVYNIVNGKIFSTEKKTISKGELFIKNGKIISESDLQDSDQIEKWDAEERYVAPGFIDMHVHVFENHALIGINADKVGIEQGVTTIVDAGSTGCENYKEFKEEVIETSETEVLSLLNISRTGLVKGLDELSSEDYLMSDEEWLAIHKEEPTIVGLKARMSQSVIGNQGIKPLEHARHLADLVDVPIMVHIGSPPPALTEVLPLLKKGDIVTHAFHGKKGGILDDKGSLIPVANEAIKRGVKLDMGHGSASFSYNTIQRFKEKYSHPFTISTDVYDKNFDKPVGSLMDTISKFLGIGYSLEELIYSVTERPAKQLSLLGYGSLQRGYQADITVFDIDDQGHHELMDSHGETVKICKRLIPYATWKNGQLVYQRG